MELELILTDLQPIELSHFRQLFVGWSGGAMVLGKHPVLARPSNLDHVVGQGLLCLQ